MVILPTCTRRIIVVDGPHDNPSFRHGPILRIKDLIDPDFPGKGKVVYVHRFLERCSIGAWSKRGRYDRRQPSARRVQWGSDDEEEAEPKRQRRKIQDS